jgi:polyisoprenoid-binding protein YceI
MKKTLLAGLLAAACTAGPAYADTYTIDPEYTIPSFEVGHLGFTHQRGRFNKTEGKVVLDLAARTGSVEFTVHTTSLDMGSHAWTVHVSSEGLLNVANYPTMTFRSEHLLFDDGKVVGAEGQFTLLGVTRPLKVEIEHFACAENPLNKKHMCAGDVEAKIKRSDYGMTKFIPTVSDEIEISVPIEAYRD